MDVCRVNNLNMITVFFAFKREGPEQCFFNSIKPNKVSSQALKNILQYIDFGVKFVCGDNRLLITK